MTQDEQVKKKPTWYSLYNFSNVQAICIQSLLIKWHTNTKNDPYKELHGRQSVPA